MNSKFKSNDPKRFLLILIHSLSKAEKRSFKLYVNRTQKTTALKTVQLFDVMDKLEKLDDELILRKLKGMTASQLSNLKRHLYQQILTSLRLVHIQKNIEIQIREQIDFARILYGKGLYFQSMRILERCRIQCQENHQDLLLLEILEFLKLIEERHITRSRQEEGKMERLESDALQRSEILLNSCRLSNLKIAIHGAYIRRGHVRNAEDVVTVKKDFEKKLAQIKIVDLTFFEKVYFHQSYVWYHHMLLDFEQCFHHAKQWIEIFENTLHLIDEDPDLYLRGYHYVLTSLYNKGDTPLFNTYLEKFDAFYHNHYDNFNHNSKMIASLYFYSAKLNQCFLSGDFKKGEELVYPITTFIKEYEELLDPHRILVFNFKIAYLYFGMGNFGKTQDYLLDSERLQVALLREDLQSYARILQLLVHYELGNFNLLESLIKSSHRFLRRLKELTKVQQETLRFFNSILNLPDHLHAAKMADFKAALEPLQEDAYEKRSFLYLDVYSWVVAKLEKRPMGKIIKEKYGHGWS